MGNIYYGSELENLDQYFLKGVVEGTANANSQIRIILDVFADSQIDLSISFVQVTNDNTAHTTALYTNNKLDEVVMVIPESLVLNSGYYDVNGSINQFSIERILVHELFHAGMMLSNKNDMSELASIPEAEREESAVNFENYIMGITYNEAYRDSSTAFITGTYGAPYMHNVDVLSSSEEIATLPVWYTNLQQAYLSVRELWDPLVIDLDGDGVSSDVLVAQTVYFDLDADGLAEATGWITADDAFLVRDINGNGKIDNGGELFGSQSVNGFDALKLLDSNGDGFITAADAAFSSLSLWQDLNQNGISEEGELTTLADAGIASIDVDNYSVAESNNKGITHTGTVETGSNIQLEIVNMAFRTDVRNTHYMQDYDLDLRALFLPTLRGYGKIADLHVALSLDNGGAADTLMSQALSFVSYNVNDLFANWASVKSEFREFLFNWAGVDGVDPSSRGTFVDAREMTFLEYYMGSAFIANTFFDSMGVFGNPGALQGVAIHESFQDIESRLLGAFFAQTGVMQLFDDAGSYSLINDVVIVSDLHLSQAAFDDLAAFALTLPDTQARQDFWLGVVDIIRGVETTTADHLTAADKVILDGAISNSDATLSWYAENHDPLGAGVTSIEYRHDNPTGETIVGTSGDDSALNGSDFEDVISGLGGADTIHGGDLADRIFGHSEDGVGDDGASDALYGEGGDDVLDGGDGDDTLLYVVRTYWTDGMIN